MRRSRTPASGEIFLNRIHVGDFRQKLDIRHNDFACRSKFDDALPLETTDFTAHGFEGQPEVIGKLGAGKRQLKRAELSDRGWQPAFRERFAIISKRLATRS
jgi:hypothetical protein